MTTYTVEASARTGRRRWRLGLLVGIAPAMLGDNLDKMRPTDRGERGVISIYEVNFVPLSDAARSRPARSNRRASMRFSPIFEEKPPRERPK